MQGSLPDSVPRVAEPEARSRDGLLRVAIGAGVAWTLLSVSALAVGDPSGVLRSGTTLLLVVVAVALARRRAVRGAIVIGAGLYTASLTAATLIAGTGLAGDSGTGRVQVLVGDPNVLAAALVTAFVAWAAVAPRRRLVWWGWPLVALAVLHTGSRTAGAALLAAAVLWLVVQALRDRRRIVLAPLLAVVVLSAAAVAWQRGVVELTPNLLAAPSDFTDGAWRRDLAEAATILADGEPGPFPGTTAQRLTARARPTSTLLVHQSIGRSEEGVPYVASIYLRTDSPQQVVLSSHLARVTCDVGEAWSRCVTPVGYGDDHAQRQLHLRAPERGGGVDLHLFGAQYERGLEATPFLDARPAWVPQTMVNRFDLRRLSFLPSNRMPPWRAGLEIAREHPWFGVGLEASRDAILERTAGSLSSPVTYAHNLLLQLLAVHGVVGLLGFAAIVVALLASIDGAGWARLAPLLVALVLLNTWDVTFFEPTGLVAAVLATAYWTGSRLAPRDRGSTEPGR